VGLRPLIRWDCGFESRRGYGYLSLVSVLCRAGRGLCVGLITRPEESECDREASTTWDPDPLWAVISHRKKGSMIFVNNQLDTQFFFMYVYLYSLHVSDLLSSRLLSKNLKIKIYRTIILPVVLYGRRWVDNIRTDLQEVGCGYMDWIELAQDRDRWRTLVSAVMNLQVPWHTGNFLTSCKPVSFWRRTLHHGVSNMFRTATCPSSGELIVSVRHLVCVTLKTSD